MRSHTDSCSKLNQEQKVQQIEPGTESELATKAETEKEPSSVPERAINHQCQSEGPEQLEAKARKINLHKK